MPTLDPPPEECLTAGTFVDSDHPDVVRFAHDACERAGADDDRSRAVAIFLAVRDGIRYDPYSVSDDPAWYRASNVVHLEAAYCIPKAVLLTASARVVGIPARLGFADVRNHLQSAKLREAMGTDVFAYHGYSELWLGDRWVKVSSAFNIELCERFGVRPTEFDGEHDALYQEFDVHDRRHMEYLTDYGTWSDLPLQKIRDDFARHYPRDLVPDDDARIAAETARFEDDARR